MIILRNDSNYMLVWKIITISAAVSSSYIYGYYAIFGFDSGDLDIAMTIDYTYFAIFTL